MNKQSDKNMTTAQGNTLKVGSNLMELIDFRIFKRDDTGVICENIYGVNVLKVREVIVKPPIFFKVPATVDYLEGMINLREEAIPVLNLAKRLGYYDEDIKSNYIIITEINHITCGFLVHDIKKIMRFSWEDIKVPPKEIQEEHNNLVTAITILNEKEIMLILDLETILAEMNETLDLANLASTKEIIEETAEEPKNILIIDDSSVARKMVRKTLETAGYTVISAVNGQEGIQKVNQLSKEAQEKNKTVEQMISVIVSDIEMPVMDGFTFTKTLKDDPNYNKIPIVLHTSLSGSTIKQKGEGVGADDFLVKFNPEALLKLVKKYS